MMVRSFGIASYAALTVVPTYQRKRNVSEPPYLGANLLHSNHGRHAVMNLRNVLRNLTLAAAAAVVMPLAAQSADDVPLRNWEVPFSQWNGASQPSGRLRMQANVQANALPSSQTVFVAVSASRRR